MVVERRGHAEDDRVGLGDPREIGSGVELAAGHGRGDLLGRDVFDITFAVQEVTGFTGIDIEPDDTIPRACIGE